jgi:hypothetical protein
MLKPWDARASPRVSDQGWADAALGMGIRHTQLDGRDGLTISNNMTLLKNAGGSIAKNTITGISPTAIPATNRRAAGGRDGNRSAIAIGDGKIFVDALAPSSKPAIAGLRSQTRNAPQIGSIASRSLA